MTKTVAFDDPRLQAGFTQIPNVILRDPSLSAGARVTYALLSSFAWQTDECWVGQKKLGQLAGVGERMIRKYLEELTDAGLLKMHRQGQQKPNRYVLFGSGPERNHSSGPERNHSSDEEDSVEEDTTDRGGEPKKVNPKVNGKVCTDAELALASHVLESFNKAAGTGLTLESHVVPLVMRIRQRPKLTAAQHDKIIAAVFAAEHWWSDPPGVEIIYGSGKQFEKSIEIARRAHASSQKAVDVNARRKAARKAQGLE